MTPRIVLVRPGPGSPDVLPIEAWQALAGRALVAPGDALGERLREAGIAVDELAEASAEALAAAQPPAQRSGGRTSLRLITHEHGGAPPGAGALADRLARIAIERGTATFVVPEPPGGGGEPLVRAVLERALAGDVEVEVVVGRQPVGHRLLELVRVMARLRAPGGCPWDREQTHSSLLRYLLDEAYELVDAVERLGPKEVAEELGDVLLQVVFHATIAREEGTYDVDDVAEGIVRKLVTRHPHVFADVVVSGPDEVVANWDEIKSREKGDDGAFAGIPAALPALAYAQKVMRRAGEPWRDAVPADAASSPADTEDEFGAALLALAASASARGIDAESALRRAAGRLRERLERVEAAARAEGVALRDLGEEDRRRLWDAAGD